VYRNSGDESAASLSRAELERITTDPRFNLSLSTKAPNSLATFFGSFPQDSVTYKMPPGFLKFAEHPGENRAFFEELRAMMNQPDANPVKLYDGQPDADGSNPERKQRSLISSVLELAEKAFAGLTNNPLGAKHIADDAMPRPERMGILEIATLIPSALRDPVIKVIQDPLRSAADAADYLLLMTYSTSMFSNYTTTKPDSVGKTRDNLDEISFTKSITGVPISPEVNYFFQSEWEYLYSGHDNAAKNLNSVTRLLFIVRLVCNYITVFSVKEVTAIVSSIQSAFAWLPPLGLILGELARAAFVAAETVIDIAALRTGHKVPLLKRASSGEWVCSPSGIVNAISNIISSEAVDGNNYKNERGLTYSNYMQFFFITKAVFNVGGRTDAATELARRTGDLIEWNIINYRNGVFSDEEKMAEALSKDNAFRLTEMKTDFSITTTVDLRMLFLSLAFAQDFSDSRGIGVPSAMPVIVTEFRGY